MDNFQKIEQIVNKSGCSYEEAKAALEACGWDMIDAIISLEREGKVQKQAEEKAAPKAEEPIEIIPEVTVHTSSDSTDDETADRNDNKKEAPKRKFRLWSRIKSILMNNRMVIIRSNGTQLADLPILAPIIALILFFWATLGISVVAMLFGFRFHFEGEDLGKTNINNTMDKATDYAEKVREDLTGKGNGRQNSDN